MQFHAPTVFITLIVVLFAALLVAFAYDIGRSRVFYEIKAYGCEKIISLHEK